jgi:hypothetical protein
VQIADGNAAAQEEATVMSDQKSVKRAFRSKCSQVAEGAANINFRQMSQWPIAVCYSEYIE